METLPYTLIVFGMVKPQHDITSFSHNCIVLKYLLNMFVFYLTENMKDAQVNIDMKTKNIKV